MKEKSSTETVLFFRQSRFLVVFLLVLFLLGGIAIRLIDFTDLPLDFGGTRELHSFIMARGLYYQMDAPETNALPQDVRQFGIDLGKSTPTLEPPFFEKLTAFTYRLIGGENMLVPRVYSILFWVIGGIPLFLLARKIMTLNGAFASLAFYLFIPFGVYNSRCFQPDVLMVMLILWSWYFMVSWAKTDRMKWAILAGCFSGLAILIKSPAAYFVGIPLAGLVLQKGFKQWIKNKQVYLMLLLSILPFVASSLIRQAVSGDAGSLFEARFFPQLFIDPFWYLRWVLTLRAVIGYFPLIIGLLSLFFFSDKQARIFFLWLWIGYILYGFTFAHHITTHNYYHLPLLPMLALGLGFALSIAFQKWEEVNRQKIWQILILVILVFSIGVSAERIRKSLRATDYRQEPQFWSEISNLIGHDKFVIALTQDYGSRLSFWGNINASLWYSNEYQDFQKLMGASNPEFETLFKELTAGKDVFLVTLMDDFESQVELNDYLFSHYAYQQGEGYLLFYLDQPLEP